LPIILITTARFVLLALSFTLALLAQSPAPAIQYDASRHIWLLTTKQNSYAMGVDASGMLQHLYWGPPLWRLADLTEAVVHRDISSFDPHQMIENEEFPGWGGPRFYECALKLTRTDGNRDLVLKYASHRLDGTRLLIELKDIRDNLTATLHFQVYPEYGIISRSATIANGTHDPVILESAQSATWYLPPGDGYRLTYLSGRWAAESQINREPIHEGAKIIESRKGHTSHNFNPWFSIDDGEAGEERGSVWFGSLAWSGNWRITIEKTPYRQVRVTGGFNSFDFQYPLAPGEALDTPEFYGGFSSAGHGGASRMLHRFEREQILPGGLTSRTRPVLYNSWEATTFNVDEPGQIQLAAKAAKLGVELFVMDDGWFGKRDNDRAGLGDWFVNPRKFPQGLKNLISHVNGLGMGFGLWVEPEMVNADSELYRLHPDWVINFPGRPRSELRNQMVLNLARDDVRDYLFAVLDKLASDYNIKYFKWDMNRAFSEPGWPEAGPTNQRKLWVRYTQNLYTLIDRLRAKHPGLEIESCSGGGGRIDLGILKRVDEVWTSDNTEAFDRLRIQEGFSQAYAPKIMSAWVTDVPNMNGRSAPLQFRFLVAMQGALGVGANLNHWADQDFALGSKMIALYKRIRQTVQLGDLYRLFSPLAGDLTANQYVSADGTQSVLFCFRHSQQYNTPVPAILLRGLEERALYRVEPLDSNKYSGGQLQLSGAYLMRNGVTVDLRGDFDSTAIVLQRVP
jgi:alpha-galactosidase